jgi:lysozyme family protein
MNFEQAFEFIKQWEGGYVNDPDDLGGETNFGITKRRYPHMDIKNLTIEQAKKIYYTDYWLLSKCDQLPDELRLMHFDCSINQGPKTAAIMLQLAINDPEVIIDGIIGRITLRHAFLATPDAYGFYRALRYMEIIGVRQVNVKFAIGWKNRLEDCLDTTYEYYEV